MKVYSEKMRPLIPIRDHLSQVVDKTIRIMAGKVDDGADGKHQFGRVDTRVITAKTFLVGAEIAGRRCRH